MDARSFHVLHDSGNQHLLPIADGVNLTFLALEVPVDQHRLVGRHLHRRSQVINQLGGILDDLHRPPAKHIAGPDDGGIPNVLSHLQRLFH